MPTSRVPSVKGDRVAVDPDAATNGPATAEGLAARFRVQNLLGEGGMGSVFVAQDRGLGRIVALKRLRDGLEKDPSAMRRFILEAQIGAQLEHPNIVPLYSFERSQNGAPAIAMQLLEGRTMAEYIRTAAAAPKDARGMRGEYSLKERIATLLGVCEAIHFAHERGVIHRDLKPDNVMLGRFREVYVMDWGLARAAGAGADLAELENGVHAPSAVVAEAPDHSELSMSPTIVASSQKGSEPPASGAREATARSEVETSPTMAISSNTSSEAPMATRQGDVMGTPQYMPPEQALGLIDRVGPAADQYALGVMLQELATLRPARSHTSTTVALSEAVLNRLAQPIDAEGVASHPALQAIVARATRKEPAERYPSVSELAADIRRFIRDEPVSVYPEGLARRLVRAAARRPVLAMGILSVCGFLASVAIVGGVVRDARQTQRHAEVLESTRRVLVAVTDRAHAIDVELSDRAADVQAVGAATAELLDRDVVGLRARTVATPALVASAAYGGAAVSFDTIAMSWPLKEAGEPQPDSAHKLDHLHPWLRQTLVDGLPKEERDGGIAAQDRGLYAGHSTLLRAFVGLEDGVFVQFPAREIPTHIDARSRPWYRMAMRDQSLHWTRPVADTTRKTVRITAVLSMHSHGDFIGVAGCDMRISVLAPKLALDLPGFRRAYLVTEDGKIAVAPDLEQRMLATGTNAYEELPLPGIDVPALGERIARGERGGYVTQDNRLVVFSRLISPPWTYVAEFDKAMYLDR
jgi:serine/threonine-protein kinase